MRKPEDVQAHSVAPSAKEAAGIADAVLETVTDSVLLLGSDLRVRFANAAFFTTFGVNPEEILGRLVYEPGDGRWALPDAREVLDYVLSSDRGVESWFGVHRWDLDEAARNPSTHPSVRLSVYEVNARRRSSRMAVERPFEADKQAMCPFGLWNRRLLLSIQGRHFRNR